MSEKRGNVKAITGSAVVNASGNVSAQNLVCAAEWGLGRVNILNAVL